MTAAAVTLLAGCASHAPVQPPMPDDVRTALPVYTGGDGTRESWAQLMDAVADADVIIVGEQHDDAVGHAVELAIVQDVLDRWPGSALSMEMLDRSEQAVVDDYLAGFIDLETFYERTASTRWRKITAQYLDGTISKKAFKEKITRLGWPDWETNYQPMVDAAKEAGSPVVAANTPWLVYMSQARKGGFEALAVVTPAQRALFEVPDEVPTSAYRQRFWEVIAGRAEGEEPPADEDSDDAGDVHGGLSDEQVLGMFRGQLVMDATMADSIADASMAGAPKVVHMVGQFHCDFEGGVVEQLRLRLPDARILVISMQREQVDALRDEDVGRADFVLYSAP